MCRPTDLLSVGGRHHSWHLPSLMGRTATAAPRSFRQLPVQIGSQRLANPTLPLMAYPIRGSNCRPTLALQCLDLTNSMACARCENAFAFPRCRHGHPGDLPLEISSHSRCGTQLLYICTSESNFHTFSALDHPYLHPSPFHEGTGRAANSALFAPTVHLVIVHGLIVQRCSSAPPNQPQATAFPSPRGLPSPRHSHSRHPDRT